MKPLLILFFFLMSVVQLNAQSSSVSLTLEACYEILYSENPVVDKIQMSREITNLNERIARSGWYPEIAISRMLPRLLLHHPAVHLPYSVKITTIFL